jgi:transposase
MNYSQLIIESEAELIDLERAQKRATARDRVRFIRLLKTDQANSQAQAGQCIGLASRQSQRLWQTYRRHGLMALIEVQHGGQYKGKLTRDQLNQLSTHLQSDAISQLGQAQEFIEDTFAVKYSISGLSALFARQHIKPKTARPSNVRQVEGAIEEFKKLQPAKGHFFR